MNTLYRYGALAWVWRCLGALAVAGVVGVTILAVKTGTLWPLAVGLPLVLPVVVLFPIVATEITLDPGTARLRVRTLAGLSRCIECERIAGHRLRTAATTDSGTVYAPRVWIAVRGGLPIYVDLLATIPDRRGFAAALGLPQHLGSR